MITIWHNPRCSKSRQTLQLLEDRGITPTVMRYLDEPPSEADLRAMLAVLNLRPIDMMRPREAVFKEMGLSTSDDDDTLIKAMAQEPRLIERPIVQNGNRAAIGRPPEAVLDIL
ncbi:MAG: arsenate reductase (glutaredoxin) [Roseovarius sp.]|nr:arsenate reductase (glutaredoxin) [Roseovarius sp.]